MENLHHLRTFMPDLEKSLTEFQWCSSVTSLQVLDMWLDNLDWLTPMQNLHSLTLGFDSDVRELSFLPLQLLPKLRHLRMEASYMIGESLSAADLDLETLVLYDAGETTVSSETAAKLRSLTLVDRWFLADRRTTSMDGFSNLKEIRMDFTVCTLV